MRKPRARPEAAARQTARDRLCQRVRVRGAEQASRKNRRSARVSSSCRRACAKDEHLIKSGDTAMDASSQVTLDTRMFGVDGEQIL